jgi:hypothetical protein
LVEAVGCAGVSREEDLVGEDTSFVAVGVAALVLPLSWKIVLLSDRNRVGSDVGADRVDAHPARTTTSLGGITSTSHITFSIRSCELSPVQDGVPAVTLAAVLRSSDVVAFVDAGSDAGLDGVGVAAAETQGEDTAVLVVNITADILPGIRKTFSDVENGFASVSSTTGVSSTTRVRDRWEIGASVVIDVETTGATTEFGGVALADHVLYDEERISLASPKDK